MRSIALTFGSWQLYPFDGKAFSAGLMVGGSGRWIDISRRAGNECKGERYLVIL